MTKIITCSELRHRTMPELQALSRVLQTELRRVAPGYIEHTVTLASLEAVRRVMATRRSRQPGLTP